MIFLLVLEGANIYLVRVNPCPPVANLRGVCKRASGGVFEITPSTPPPGSGLGGGGDVRATVRRSFLQSIQGAIQWRIHTQKGCIVTDGCAPRVHPIDPTLFVCSSENVDRLTNAAWFYLHHQETYTLCWNDTRVQSIDDKLNEDYMESQFEAPITEESGACSR